MTTFRNVLLIGGSGTLGSVLLKALEESSYNVTVLSRQESTSQLPEGTKVIRADYGDTSSLEAAMKGQDVVISTVGPTVTGGQKPFIDAAVAAGVKRFIPSEFGPDTLDPRVTEFIPVLPFKVQTVDYLRTKEDKMEWTSLITSLWFDWALRDGHIGFDLDTKTATITDGGKGQFTGTTLDRVAKATVGILDHADKTRNTYVYTASFHLCQNDLLALLEKIDGQKWTVKHEESKELIQEGHRRFQQGNFTGIPLLVKALATGPGNLGDISSVELWDDKLGIEPEDLEQVVRRVIAEKRGPPTP